SLPYDRVVVVLGDTARTPYSCYGSADSRGSVTGGAAVLRATSALRQKLLRVAARLLEADEADLEVVDSQCRVRGAPGRGLSFAALAQESLRGQNLPDGMEPELEARFTYNPENWTFPYGVHVAAVEVARDTGRVHLLGYWVAHDCGTMLNPMLVDGQLHGGPAHCTEGLRAPPDRPALTPGQEAHGVDCQEFLRPLWRANQARGGTPMPKIRHIALSTQDVEKTAKFYVETFGMKEVGKVDDPGTRGVFLTDGDINLAILNFKNDTAAGSERGKNFAGIHHIGFQVDSLEAIAERR